MDGNDSVDLNIKCASLGIEVFIVKIVRASKILDLKLLIQTNMQGNPPIEYQRLIYHGKICSNDETLEEYTKMFEDPNHTHNFHLVLLPLWNSVQSDLKLDENKNDESQGTFDVNDEINTNSNRSLPIISEERPIDDHSDDIYLKHHEMLSKLVSENEEKMGRHLEQNLSLHLPTPMNSSTLIERVNLPRNARGNSNQDFNPNEPVRQPPPQNRNNQWNRFLNIGILFRGAFFLVLVGDFSNFKNIVILSLAALVVIGIQSGMVQFLMSQLNSSNRRNLLLRREGRIFEVLSFIFYFFMSVFPMWHLRHEVVDDDGLDDLDRVEPE